MRHLFGVPGDFNLEFLQQVDERGRPAWIGNCNELNASYAADGYARLNGLAGLVVTNGVGALSAINGIAGAYCEHVPVICICGSLPRKSVDRRMMLHHTLAEGGHRDFFRAFVEVTAAQAQLTPANAAGEIDRMIRTAWLTKCPVYLELPSDIAYLDVEVPEAPLALALPGSDEERLEACAGAIAERLAKAEAPAVLLDLDADRFGALGAIAALADKLQLPVATVASSKGCFSERSPHFAGVYVGAGSGANLRKTVEESDCLLMVGYRRVDTNTGFLTDNLPADAIALHAYSADVGAVNYQAVTLGEVLARVSASVPPARGAFRAARAEGREAREAKSKPHHAGAAVTLTQKAYWREMQAFLRPGDVVVAEDGTSSAGASSLVLPEGSTFVTQALWGSIGYTMGALLGTMLAAPGRRHILFIGDGALQCTVQELSTLLRQGLAPRIFVINNGGYTIERAILGKDAKYNDIANWRYADLPKAFARKPSAKTFLVENVDELRAALETRYEGLVLVEAILDRGDVPAGVVRGGRAIAEMDYGPRGPQSDPDVQLPMPARER